MDVVNRILFPTPAPSYSLNDFPNELIFIPKRPFGSKNYYFDNDVDVEHERCGDDEHQHDARAGERDPSKTHSQTQAKTAQAKMKTIVAEENLVSEQTRALNPQHLENLQPEMETSCSQGSSSSSSSSSSGRSAVHSNSLSNSISNSISNSSRSRSRHIAHQIHPPHTLPQQNSGNSIGKSNGAEDPVACLLLKSPSARFLFIYLHSNAEDLGRCYQFLQVLRGQFQVHVLAVEYPGYGVCPGHACEESVVANAIAAMEFAINGLHWPLDEIIVIGRSIGSGPATVLAAKYEVCGLVLVCPFFSVREVVKDYLGSAGEVFRERFPNYENIQKVRSQLLLVHGQADTVVPYMHGKRLFDLCPARKQLIVPVLMKHNSSLSSDASYFALPMLHFFGLPDYKFEDIVVPEWVFHRYRPEPPEESPHRGCACIIRNEGNTPLVCQVQGPASRTTSSPMSPKSGTVRGGAPDAAEDLQQRREQVLHVQMAVRELFEKAKAKASLRKQVIGGLNEDSDDSEDLPEIPDDLGFFKAPPSRGVGLLGSPNHPSAEDFVVRPRPYFPSSPTRGPHRTARKAVQPRAPQESPDQLPIPESPSPPDWPNPPTPPNGRSDAGFVEVSRPTGVPPSVVNV